MSEEMKYDLSGVHAVNLKLLKEIDRICRKYKIKYALDSGTLLGAIRHGGFIPWDDDVDVVFTRANYEMFKKVARRELQEGISLRLDGETRDDLSERFRELWIPEVEERLILTHEHEEVERKTSEELRRELDELLKQKREMDFQLAKKRADHPSLDWWLEPARTETPRIGLDESLKQLASQFEAIAPEEDKKPLLVPVYSPRTERLSRSDGIA